MFVNRRLKLRICKLLGANEVWHVLHVCWWRSEKIVEAAQEMETDDGVFENKHEMKRQVKEVVVVFTSALLFGREGVNLIVPFQQNTVWLK